MSTSAITDAHRLPEGAAVARPRSLRWKVVLGINRVERRKLCAQLSTRILALACLLGPPAFALVLKLQSGLPADTLFGVWVHQSGYAVSLVVLGFAGSWGFPVIAGVLAGDLFAGEDRHGTWKMILSRSASRQEVFAGKLVAAGTLAVGLVALTALSSVVAGLATSGNRALIGLSGAALHPGHALVLVLAAWGASILPTLGFVALAALFSMATRNGIAGALGPVLVALLMQLLDLMGNGSWVHAALLGSAFSGWHGFFVAHTYVRPLIVGSVVSLCWIVAALQVCWHVMRRRDFTGAAGAMASWARAGAIVLGSVVALAVVAAGTGLGPSTITAARLQAALTPAFSNLTLMQQRLLGRRVRPGVGLRIMPKCLRHGGSNSGLGDDWTCTLDVFVPQHGVEPFRQTAVTYEMSVQSNGCYKASGPPTFIGQQTIRDARGAEVVNPLYTIYGCFETDG